jgi:hypothetical protein
MRNAPKRVPMAGPKSRRSRGVLHNFLYIKY